MSEQVEAGQVGQADPTQAQAAPQPEPVESTQSADAMQQADASAADQQAAELKSLDGNDGLANAVNAQAGSVQAGGLNMDSLLDVPVTLSVEIGRKRMPINQLVNLTPGAIVDLNRDLDAPLDLLVNGTLIARGEVVVMGKKFGLRLVDICNPNEHIAGLS